MKQSKYCRKKLPPNREGLYSFYDPYQFIELSLLDWYEDTSLIPRTLAESEIFTDEELIQFQNEINQNWLDLEEQACQGFNKDLFPYINYSEAAYRKKQVHKFSTFDSWEYLQQISPKIASYKCLLQIRGQIEQILFRPERLRIFKEMQGEIYYIPGQRKDELLKLLIKDLEFLSDKFYPDTKKKEPRKSKKLYRSVLAFYLAKQDIFDHPPLVCVNKRSKTEPCSTISCISLERENCIAEVQYQLQQYGPRKIDISTIVMLCEKEFYYPNCKKCNSYIRSLSLDDAADKKRDNGPFNLFLETPCEPALLRYNNIIDRLREDEKRGPKGTQRDILILRGKLISARSNKDRKEISAIYREAEKLFPVLSRKKIQRILSK